MSRREFSRKQYAQIILRATDSDGVVCCEGCGLRLGRKPFEVDHIIPEALIIDKSKPLTIEDGQLLGKECCHKAKTAQDVGRIRKSDRQRDKHSGAFRRHGQPMAGSRRSPFKHKMNGEVVRRDGGTA